MALRSDINGGAHPPVSVVMPVHNAERFVSGAVQSILDQDFADFELVVGNDGSTDRTGEIIAELAARDRRIRIIERQAKSGLAQAMNWVVSNARGELVAMAHADDISYSDRLSRGLSIFAATPDVTLVGSPADGLDQVGRIVHPPNLWRVLHPRGMAPFAHSSIMFRRSAFELVGGYRSNADYWEDLDLFWRLAARGHVMIIPKALTGYRYSSGSVRSRDGQDLVESAVQRMYDRAGAIAAQGCYIADHEVPVSHGGPLRPRVFIARAWVDVWNGRRTRVLPRMIAKARLGLNRETVEALAFLTLASVVPGVLRALLAGITGIRNRLLAPRLGTRGQVEWKPF